jgi:hypothetical protein
MNSNLSKHDPNEYFSDDNDVNDVNEQDEQNNQNNPNDYFSDDEVPEQDVRDELEQSEDEMDEETRRIIFAAASKNSIMDFFQSKQTPAKSKEKKSNESETKKQGKKVMTLDQFNKKVDAEEKAKKPIKFVSKRAVDKKKQLGLGDDNQVKRSFNPRLPPYNFVHKKINSQSDVNLNNKDDFPSL